jgi:hypothetical protein
MTVVWMVEPPIAIVVEGDERADPRGFGCPSADGHGGMIAVCDARSGAPFGAHV